MTENKIYFFNKIGQYQYLFSPLICKFDTKCNGSCYSRNFQVNHTDIKYCLDINCTSSTCKKNHLINWKNKSNIVDLCLVSTIELSNGIYLYYGEKFVRNLLFENVDIDSNFELFRHFELKINEAENRALTKEDHRYYELLNKEIAEKEKRKIEKQIEKQIEKTILGIKMVKVYINLRNIDDLEDNYEKIILNRFKDKMSLFNIIKQFLGTKVEKKMLTFTGDFRISNQGKIIYL